MGKIEETLAKIFSAHRIVFWYDDNQELRGQFNEMELQGIDKILVENNQFYIKHLVCKEKPDNKFLLYFPSAKPANSDNWLLDLELGNYLFQTSQEALFAQELGLDYHYTDLIAEHIDFFKNKERRALLKQMLGKDDEHRAIRYKMLAVLFDTENPTLVSFLQAHASAYNDGNARHDRELERFNLKKYYWKEISRKLGYTSDKPSIYDFLIELFNKNFSLGKNQGLFKEARHLIAMWKDTISYQEAFKQLSGKIATDLQVEQMLNDATIDEVINDDLFELIDKKIISDLAEMIDSENITADKLNQFIKKRENKYWYYHFQHFYAALSQAMQMISFIRKHEKHKIDNFIDGINDYTKELFKIDYAYRKFIYHYRQAKQNKVLQQLAEKVEKVYCNDWLLAFGNQWQKAVDSEKKLVQCDEIHPATLLQRPC
ncbi:MAG: BREX-1 system phosphatase PglZ type A [Prolixibacteraceae bacterium]|nr:BREX-1 system phosphatase PglZ type A [Prolixibacteraceae bacterium]